MTLVCVPPIHMGGSVELKVASFLKRWKYVSKADMKTDLLNLLCIIYDAVLSVSKIYR